MAFSHSNSSQNFMILFNAAAGKRHQFGLTESLLSLHIKATKSLTGQDTESQCNCPA